RFGDTIVLDDVELELGASGYVCIMGPSGCGKTTLLRIVAGLERADAGTVTFDGAAIDALPAERRPFRLLFQHGALFPHLSVADNVGFALSLAGTRGDALRSRVDELLVLCGLPLAIADRAPETLSGGERQRVALARALAGDPRVLLLDEPLTAIDRPQRAGLRDRLRALQRESGRLFVHVTHDPEEALALADRLVVMQLGRVLASGAPETLYRRPPDATTARLLGELTALPGDPERSLRPERLRVANGHVRAGGTCTERILHGDTIELVLAIGEQIVRLRSPDARASLGDDVELCWDDDDVLPFAAR
ncbi:MAG TPA: ABC transporter ATP-binding protein, partial [Nannocystaceae bacterium]|nr:ABC transporter ATP-binding protein [Nannocystaceae bacterium]